MTPGLAQRVKDLAFPSCESCGLDSGPGLETSIFCECSHERKKKKGGRIESGSQSLVSLFLNFIEVELVYSVVLISTDSKVTHLHTHTQSHCHTEILRDFSVLYSRSGACLLAIK